MDSVTEVNQINGLQSLFDARNRLEVTDQNGTVHGYERDRVGRLRIDAVGLASGSAIDGHVQRIERDYEERGMLAGWGSYSAASGGTLRNEVKLGYNAF